MEVEHGRVDPVFHGVSVSAAHKVQEDLTPLCARAGDELEQIRPSVYRNVARQLHIPLQSEPVVTDAFLAVAGHIFSAGRSGLFT